MITAKKFIELLIEGSYHPDMEVIDVMGLPIVHITNIGDKLLISSSKPIGYCNKCGEYVYPEKQLDYKGYCPNCDENMFEFEISELEEERKEYYNGTGKNPEE